MRKSAVLVIPAIVLILYAGLIGAESLAIGNIKLSAAVITIEKDLVLATGEPKLQMPDALVTAKTIKISLVKGKDGKLTIGKAIGSGNVIIHARQTDKKTNTSRTVDANAQNAEAIGDDRIILSGNARVKISDPDLAEPASLSGETITVFLKTSKIEAQQGAGKQAELNLTPKANKPSEKK
ncbi:MAG: hypothetical protein QHH26_01980 [Armatimonadota bacterium]|nr:hypothetical protein [Armatimonadota bacterium]